MPALRRVAVLWNAGNPSFTRVCQSVDAAPGSLGLVLVSDPVREPEDFPAAFQGIASQRPEGVFVLIGCARGSAWARSSNSRHARSLPRHRQRGI